MSTAFSEAAVALLAAAGEEPAASDTDRFARLNQLLDERRAKTFPTEGFRKVALPDWASPTEQLWSDIDVYNQQLQGVDDEMKRLSRLFEEALRIPEVADAEESVECPLCGTDDALTPERVAYIRQSLEDTKAFTSERDAAQPALKFRDVAVEFFCLFKGIDEYELYGSAYTVIFCSSS